METVDVDAYLSKRNIKTMASKNPVLVNSFGQDGVPFLWKFFDRYDMEKTLRLIKKPYPIEALGYVDKEGNNLILHLILHMRATGPAGQIFVLCSTLDSLLPYLPAGVANKKR